MSVFDPFHHDHINTPVNTPLITPLELQMVGGVSHENWRVITPPWGGLDKSLYETRDPVTSAIGYLLFAFVYVCLSARRITQPSCRHEF